MAFFGKLYTHESNENFDDFVNSLNLPEEQATAYLNSKISQKIEKDGDEYVLTTNKPSGPSVMRFKSGVEFDEKITAEVIGKNTITVHGNKVTQVQKLPDGKTITFAREYSPDKLVVTITASFWNGTAKRIYVA
ncbi:fatty acid-binding protein 2-like [Pieris brassicae]|uniref:fatty acid-binding protein 2-like n=1 Tax=Pieris brassicae TaxID=7116 RepID=UPI001E660A93|nr:fatty acid-binding protein 2-like [Pieris brassicae]